MNDRQNTPTGYAVDQVEFAADDLGHDAANAAVSGTKLAIKRGRDLFQRQREKRASEGGQEHTAPAEQAPASEPVDLGRQIPWQGGDSPPVNWLPRYEDTVPKDTIVKCPDADPVSTVERGRDYARKQAAKRMERTRQIQNRMGQSKTRGIPSRPLRTQSKPLPKPQIRQRWQGRKQRKPPPGPRKQQPTPLALRQRPPLSPQKALPPQRRRRLRL